MEEIIESIRNGQRKQALHQLINSSFTLDDLFVELEWNNQSHEIIVMYRIAVNQGYLVIVKEAE